MKSGCLPKVRIEDTDEAVGDKWAGLLTEADRDNYAKGNLDTTYLPKRINSTNWTLAGDKEAPLLLKLPLAIHSLVHPLAETHTF